MSRTAELQRLSLVLLLLTAICGCASGLMNLPAGGFLSLPDLKGKKSAKKTVKKESDNEFGSRVETPLLSEYISVQGNNLVTLRGVGLVTGLDGTGDNPPPSAQRTALRDEMTRRGIKNPEQILASKNTALVIVTALLPAMVHKDQHFDVRVALPPNSQATSLKGGWLLDTRLMEEQNVEGRGTLKGREYAVAAGAILTELGIRRDPTQLAAELRRGSIPGGAVSRTDRHLSIVLRADKRGFRNAKRISNAVAARFHDYDRYGRRVPLVDAKTDTMLELKMHKTYRNNFPRYQQVIRSIAFNEGDVARRMRMESLERDIMEPATAGPAALQLEAIGESGIPFLKRALVSTHFEVQFHAAQSLAYLDDASGVKILKEAVAEHPALRVYALAALSVIDDADAVVALRELMSHKSLETRYGAFRALQELDPNDPSLVYSEFENRFKLYLIDSAGEPMSHITRRRAPEIVLFGADQPVHMPAVLTAGRNIRVIGEAGEYNVTVIRYSLTDDEPKKLVVPNRLAAIIQACGEFDATYPDIAQMLIEAQQQHNLSGQFGIDQLPQAGRMMFRESEGEADTDAADSDESGRRIGSPAMIPNLYDRLDEDELRRQETDERLSALRFDQISQDDEPEQSSAVNDEPGRSVEADQSELNAPQADGTDRKENDSDSNESEDDESEDNESGSEEFSPAEEMISEELDITGMKESSTEQVDLSKLKPGPAARIKSFLTKPFSAP